MDAKQSVEEFDISNFNKEKNYVIEASAGTGKTYTIVEIVKSLLNSGVPLDKILIVTYTEKAAGELKDRIRKGLEKLPNNIQNNTHNDVDNASIGTIHAFCQNIINEFFISAGKPSCQKLIDESEIKEFLKRYVRKVPIYEDICKYKGTHTEERIEETLEKKICAYIEKYYLNKNGELDIISFNEMQKAFFEGDILRAQELLDAMKQLESCGEKKATELHEYITTNKNVYFSGNVFQERYFKTVQGKEAFNEVKRIKDDCKKIDDIIHKTTFKYLDDIYLTWQKEKENLCEQTYNDMIRNVREEVVTGRPLLAKIQEKYTYAIIDEFQDTNQKQWDIFKTAFMSEGHNLIVVGDPKQSIYSFQGADVTVYEKATKEIQDNEGECFSLRHNYRATREIIQSTNAFFDQGSNPDALSTDMKFEYSEVGNDKFKVQYCGQDTEAFWISENEITPEDYAKTICNQIVDFCTTENGKTKLQIWDEAGKQRDVTFKDFAVLAKTRSEMVPIQKAFEKCGIPYSQYKDTNLFSGKECANWLAVLEAIKAPDFSGNNRAYFRKAMFTYFFGYSFDSIRSSDFDKDSGTEINLFSSWKALAANCEWAKLIECIIVESKLAEKMQSLGNIKAYGTILQIGDYCIDYLTRTNNLDMLIQNLRKQASKENDEEDGENSDLVAKSTDMDCVRIMTIHASKGLEFPVVISVAGFKGENNQVVKVYSYHKEGNNYLSFIKNDFSTDETNREYQRLYYVAYTRAKYLLLLPRYKIGTIDKNGNPVKDEYVKQFVKDSIDNYVNNKGKQAKNAIFDYHQMPLGGSLEALKDKVKEICSRNTPKFSETVDLGEREKWLKKEFASKLYFHFSRKHAYSSLSHGEKADETDKKESIESNESESDIQQNDTSVIENDNLKYDKDDGDLTVQKGLSTYDENPIVIECNYDKTKQPIELSKNFIAGTSLGNALHRVFELIDYTRDNDDIDGLIEKCFAEENIHCKEEWIKDVKEMVQNVTQAKLPTICGKANGDFSLKDIPMQDRKNEVEFNFNIDQSKKFSHYMNGFVDLIFKRGEYYSILDWKSDKLNDDKFTCYNDGKTIKAHVDELYSIQRVLYSYCLIKWLKQFYNGKSDQEIFDEHFGGIYYVFLRGCNAETENGIYAQTWENFDVLEKEYQKIVRERVH